MTPAWRHLPRALRLETSSPRTPKTCPSLSRAFWRSVTKLGLHTKPRMPPCDFTPEKYQSMPYSRVLEVYREHLSPELAYFPEPLLLHQGHMQWLFDHKGNRYLDFFSGIVTVSVGHCHPKVNAVAQKQLGRLWHTSALFFHPPIHEYAEKLSALLPDPLKVIFLMNSGSEANDLAMLMARAHSKNTDIISFRIQAAAMPLNCCQAKDQYIEQFKDTLSTCVGKSIAGFFAEPIQGVNGFVQYPKGFLKEAFQLVRERGGVCIADEVQTGFGRLGSHFWGFQTHGVLPDIVTMAKGIGNGFPMAAVVTTPEIAKSLAKCVLHFNTFGGNPMACAIGSAVLETSRQPLPREEVSQIHEDCRQMGLIVGRGGLFSQTFRIAPSLCITKPEADFAVDVFRAAVTQHMERRAK
ncbi:Alanine--glyoxylate aminotransferase 2, mitochondrial [Myotis davidii]|uniref:Alanine--glyoxylate aminotransferase 2, mitochondrial n=1 Tax=Myotis davidii TaxID=225400 RepID=L5M038_MYODS|nr:Alanine--glyoxylate aminotransferase 2, mitochondrial [Myotis davidii]